ncbi:MAG: hypothetical protein P8X63_01215, partial [Desulfuromonadaceae bacterium]
MAIVYLEPADLTASQQGRVLEFLNRAGSAAELAEMIEFPDELDIGIRLAQRLLNARSEAGGTFTSLKQVAAVPLIGPERFTEICAAALGLDPRNLSGKLNFNASWQQQFTRDYARLQSQLETLLGRNEQVVLDLQCATQPAWLGQPLELRLYAHDSGGRPLANRRLTVEASNGMLEVAYGLAVQSGKAVEVRTGADGSVRLNLRYLPEEPLSVDQQAALEEILARLDPTAPSPHLLKEIFFQIAALYQQERSSSLREAMDIYAKEGKSRFFDQLNASNLGFHWPQEMCVLRADYHPDDTGAACSAKAVKTVRWKNWVGAWFEFLGEYLNQKADLKQTFGKAKGRGAEGFRLVDDLIGESHCFVADQQGLAAQWLSQREVQFAVHDFLATEIEELDADTQRELFSHLELAAESLTPASRGTLSAVRESRVQLDSKIDRIVGINTEFLDQMDTLQKAIDAKATVVEAAARSVQDAVKAMDAKATEFDAKYVAAVDDIGKVRLELDAF